MSPGPVIATPAHRSRRLWEAVERFHACVYTAPEPRETATAAGLRGFWMNYFATRAAPMGAVSASTVESVFFYYGPERVRRAIPDAWTFSNPAAVLDARYAGMSRALGRLVPDANPGIVSHLRRLLGEAIDRGGSMGRPLFAGWADLVNPDEPLVELWHQTTVLREHRSGSHLLALCDSELDGCESVLTHVAAGGAPAVWITDEAKWSQDAVASATESLQRRGWFDATGALTVAGREGRQRVEERTDALDARLWRALSDDEVDEITSMLLALQQRFPPDDQLDWEAVYNEPRSDGPSSQPASR